MKNLPYLLLLIGAFFTGYVSAQPEMDTTFSSDGKLVVQFNAIGSTQDMVVQPDDKIVLIGSCFGINFGTKPFCLIRLNPDGSFDTSFNGGGTTTGGYVVTTIPGSSGGSASGIALQSDGKIVAVGYGESSGQSRRMVLIRYNADGSLDQTFGTGGIITVNYIIETQGNKVAVQPDGKIVVVGSTGSRQFVARFTTSGAPDVSFGTNGSTTVGATNSTTYGTSLALQPDGKIVTGGLAVESGTAYLVARLNADGSPDTTFDRDGLQSVAFTSPNFGPDSGLSSIAVQSDGRILAVGRRTNVLFRFTQNGALDTSFDVDGVRQALFGASDPYAVKVTPSGKITAIGFQTIPSSTPIVYRTAHYLPNGATDTSYSDDGYLDIDVAPSFNDGATAGAFDSRGRLVLAGLSSGGGTVNIPFQSAQFSVARLLATPSRSVSFAGRITYANGKPISGATLTIKRGTETIAVGRSNPFGYYRFQNLPSGQTYDLSVMAKSTTFAARTVLVDDEINDFLIVGDKSTQQ